MDANLSEGDYESNYAVISSDIYNAFIKSKKNNFIVLGIGSCLAIGDSVGPFVGTQVNQSLKYMKAYGTIHKEINGNTYKDYYREIVRSNPCSFYVAVDAMITDSYSAGSVIYSENSIYPCKAFGIKTIPLGNVSIKASVGSWKETESVSLMQHLNSVDKNIVDNLVKDIMYLLQLVDSKLEEYYSVN